MSVFYNVTSYILVMCLNTVGKKGVSPLVPQISPISQNRLCLFFSFVVRASREAKIWRKSWNCADTNSAFAYYHKIVKVVVTFSVYFSIAFPYKDEKRRPGRCSSSLLFCASLYLVSVSSFLLPIKFRLEEEKAERTKQ